MTLGSETEIVSGHQQVVARMATLAREREKAQLEPVTNAEIEFVGKEEGVDLLSSVIKELGTVTTNKGISAEHSTITEAPTKTHHTINQAFSFQVILKDKVDSKASPKTICRASKSLTVEVTGPSEVKVNKPNRSFHSSPLF